MKIKTVEFVDLEKETSRTRKSFLDYLASDVGKVYVVAITRDNCPACEKQKPKLDQLAENIVKKYRVKTVFIRIHVKRPVDSETESLRSKDMLGHYFYPTNLILLRTRDRGVFEYYRNASPRISELKRNIETAFKIADRMEKEA